MKILKLSNKSKQKSKKAVKVLTPEEKQQKELQDLIKKYRTAYHPKGKVEFEHIYKMADEIMKKIGDNKFQFRKKLFKYLIQYYPIIKNYPVKFFTAKDKAFI